MESTDVLIGMEQRPVLRKKFFAVLKAAVVGAVIFHAIIVEAKPIRAHVAARVSRRPVEGSFQ